jgi:hypothetical protein
LLDEVAAAAEEDDDDGDDGNVEIDEDVCDIPSKPDEGKRVLYMAKVSVTVNGATKKVKTAQQKELSKHIKPVVNR